jgi:hypothetical protein
VAERRLRRLRERVADAQPLGRPRERPVVAVLAGGSILFRKSAKSLAFPPAQTSPIEQVLIGKTTSKRPLAVRKVSATDELGQARVAEDRHRRLTSSAG